jgi:hypothetical protein
VFGRTEERDKNIGMVAPDNEEWKVHYIKIKRNRGTEPVLYIVYFISNTGSTYSYEGTYPDVNQKALEMTGQSINVNTMK